MASIFIWAAVLYLLAGLKVVSEYERGVRFTLGKYTGLMRPGLCVVFPIIQTWTRIDLRTRTIDVPSQDCVTKDNVVLRVNAVLYYKVEHPQKAILQVESYNYAISQLAQTTMRNAIGEMQLDELLQKREEISQKIKTIVDKETDPWGIDVERIEVKDIELPENMQRTLAKVAEAMRERDAVIIKASGEVEAAKNMAKAAETLSKSPGALHLRTLQTLNDLSSDQSNTVVFAVPIEVLRAIEGKKR